MAIAARAWLRYAAPFTLLSALAFAPIAFVAARLPLAADGDGVRAQLVTAWIVAGVAWIPLLVLVAAVAPAVRALARREPLHQSAALSLGTRGLVRALVPCAIAAAAVVIGFAALVVPGFVLLVLVAPTGASERLGEAPPAPLLDAVAAARARPRAIAIVLAATLATGCALVAIAQWRMHLFGELPKRPPPATLAAARSIVRWLAAALVIGSPLPACAIAAAYESARSQRSS